MSKNNKWGFVDKVGNIVVSPKYDEVGSFSEGLALVGQNNKWGFIDKTGKVVIPLKYEDADNFHDGIAGVLDASTGETFYINKQGERLYWLGAATLTRSADKAKAATDYADNSAVN